MASNKTQNKTNEEDSNNAWSYFVGLGFLILVIVQIVLFYYETTINPINPIIAYLFLITLLVVLGICGEFVYRVYAKDKYLQRLMMSFLGFAMVLVAFTLFSSTPTAQLSYSTKCPTDLSSIYDSTNNIIITYNNMGPVFGNIHISLNTSDENISIKNPGNFASIPFKFRTELETLILFVNISSFEGSNFTIGVQLKCQNNFDCVATPVLNNPTQCSYQQSEYDKHYYTLVKN